MSRLVGQKRPKIVGHHNGRSLIMIFSDECADKYPMSRQCPSWAGFYCNNWMWKDWMTNNCKKSCNRCGGKVFNIYNEFVTSKPPIYFHQLTERKLTKFILLCFFGGSSFDCDQNIQKNAVIVKLYFS